MTKLLKGQPEDKEVMLSVDAEGNDFKRLYDISTQSRWWPEAEELWDSKDRAGEEAPDSSYPVLILWPG